MGLYFAWSRRPKRLTFYQRRLKRIIIPYLFLAAPLFLTLFSSKNRKLCFVLVTLLFLTSCYLFYFRFPERYKMYDIAIGRFWIFLFGCYMGKPISEKKPMSRYWILFCLISIFTPTVLSSFLATPLAKIYFPRLIFRRISTNIIGFALCIWLPLFLEVLDSPETNAFLGFLGNLSLELYLLHIIFRNLVAKYFFPSTRQLSFFPALLLYALILLASVLVGLIYSKLSDRFSSRTKGTSK